MIESIDRLGHMLSQQHNKTYRHDSTNLSPASARLAVGGDVKVIHNVLYPHPDMKSSFSVFLLHNRFDIAFYQAYILGAGITGVLTVPYFSGSKGDVVLWQTLALACITELQ